MLQARPLALRSKEIASKFATSYLAFSHLRHKKGHIIFERSFLSILRENFNHALNRVVNRRKFLIARHQIFDELTLTPNFQCWILNIRNTIRIKEKTITGLQLNTDLFILSLAILPQTRIRHFIQRQKIFFL